MVRKLRKYRFFFHWNKPTKKWSVHFRGKCYTVDDLACMVPCEAKINKRQPFRVMQGWAEHALLEGGFDEPWSICIHNSSDENLFLRQCQQLIGKQNA